MSDPKTETFRKRLRHELRMAAEPFSDFMLDEAVRLHGADMQAKEEAHAKTESELGLLLAARREAHIRLGQYGIRSHYFIGEDPRFPQGKECSVVDRINLMAEALEQARKRIEELEVAIREHRDQRGDDRCWIDDLKLYAKLGDTAGTPISDQALPSPEEMLSNCRRFIASRHPPGCDYVSPQREVERAEREAADLRAEVERLKGELGEHNDQDLANCQCMGCRFGAAILDRVSLREKLKALEEENKALKDEIDHGLRSFEAFQAKWAEIRQRDVDYIKALRAGWALDEALHGYLQGHDPNKAERLSHAIDTFRRATPCSLLSDSSQPSTPAPSYFMADLPERPPLPPPSTGPDEEEG